MAKDRMIQEWDQGWKFAQDDRSVCGACFDDDALKAFIKVNAEAKVCSYCGRRSKKAIAAPINSVLELIGESLHSEWGNPDDECRCSSSRMCRVTLPERRSRA